MTIDYNLACFTIIAVTAFLLWRSRVRDNFMRDMGEKALHIFEGGMHEALRQQGGTDDEEEYDVYSEIQDERDRQMQKWGQQDHPCLDPTLLEREGGCSPERMAEHYEICTDSRAKQLCDMMAKQGNLTWAHIAIEEMAEAVCEFDEDARRTELVQTAAVLVAWIEAIDRRNA